ncbi:hypothetical protein LDENG_00094790 [Lucifuga dentata]|nr:hypothetical protein LDENG_00094790 [Lucifuga dentata]
MKDYDETIAFLGELRCFQKMVFFLLCASIIPNGLGVFAIIFVGGIPSHHCLIPEVNLTQEWRNAVIPIKMVNGKEELSRCSRYRLDVVRNLSAQGFIPDRNVNLTDLEQESCLDGWSYSKDIYQSTIVSEFDLVCSEQWKLPFTSTVFFIGVLSGSFFSGQLSDRFGRKPVLFATMAVQMIFTFAQIFSPSWTTFTILYFFSGLGQISNYVAALVLGTEILRGSVRVLYSALGVVLFYAIGYMMLPLFAYFLRDWKSLLLAVSLVGLAFIPSWWFIPESPRWLLSQNRVQEAEAIVRRAAKKNKVQAPQVIFKDYRADETKTECKTREHYNLFDLVKISHVRATTLIFCLVWFTLTACYIGVSLNSAQLHPNPYIGCFISAAIEVPAYVSSWLAMKYFSRRLSLSSIMLLGGVSLYILQLVPQSLLELLIVLEMLGKYGITAGSAMIYVYTAEVYPTGIRNTAIGICSMVSRVGSCIAPFFLELRQFYKDLPYIILGSLAVLCAASILFLPESFRQPLPETLQQMQKRKRIECPCIPRKEKTQSLELLETQV